MIKIQSESIPEIIERPLRVLAVRQQHLPRGHSLDLWSLPRFRPPLIYDRLGLSQFAFVLVMKAVIVEELFRPRNQLLESGLAVCRQGKRLDKLNLPAPGVDNGL